MNRQEASGIDRFIALCYPACTLDATSAVACGVLYRDNNLRA